MSCRKEHEWPVGVDGQDSLCLVPIPQKVWCLLQELTDFLKKYALKHSVCMRSQVEVLKISNQPSSSVTEKVLACELDFSC